MAENINQVDVVNMALTQLGQTPITAFGQNAGGAVILQRNYEQEVKALLRRIPWSFARTWVTLAQLPTIPITLTIEPDEAGPGAINYTAAYQLPPDFLRLYRMSPYDCHWRIIDNQIYTDAVPAVTLGALLGLQPPNADGADNAPPTPTSTPSVTIGIEYIRRVDDPGTWDSLFMDALIMRLKYMLSFGMTGLVDIRPQLKQDYQEALMDASAVNGMENWPDVFNNNLIQDVRFGYSGISIDGI